MATKINETLSGIVLAIAFILLENLARWSVCDYGLDEFWLMLISYFGYLGIILWRGQRRCAPNSKFAH